MRFMPARRFPPPEELDACFVVPHCGQVFAYVPYVPSTKNQPCLSRALRVWLDILFFFLRCTEIQYPSLKFPSRYWTGMQPWPPSRRLNLQQGRI